MKLQAASCCGVAIAGAAHPWPQEVAAAPPCSAPSACTHSGLRATACITHSQARPLQQLACTRPHRLHILWRTCTHFSPVYKRRDHSRTCLLQAQRPHKLHGVIGQAGDGQLGGGLQVLCVAKERQPVQPISVTGDGSWAVGSRSCAAGGYIPTARKSCFSSLAASLVQFNGLQVLRSTRVNTSSSTFCLL